MAFHTHTLGNGLEIICETSPTARSAAVGFFVRTGSRDEIPGVAGVSHFLEHMVFKGTPRRSAQDVNLDFDRIGASYNAYTSEENTVFHAQVLPEYLPQAVDILTDILRPSLREPDFDTEKKVILEEIGMYEDQPAFLAIENARKIYYGSHPLGNSVLGSTASVEALTRDQMLAYFRRRYVAPNILVALAGNVDWPRARDLIASYCEGWESGEAPRESLVETGGTGGEHVFTSDKSMQEHVILIAGGPPSESPMRYAADVLALAVGDDSGSRLFWELIETGRADSAECNFYEYQANGTFYTMLSGDPKQVPENIDIAKRILTEVRTNGITEDELRQAKSKITSILVRAAERSMGRMGSIAAAWQTDRTYRDVDEELARFEAVSLVDIREVLQQYPIDRVTTVAYGPMATLADG